MYFQMAEKEKTQKYIENQQKQKEKSVRICAIPTDFGRSVHNRPNFNGDTPSGRNIFPNIRKSLYL